MLGSFVGQSGLPSGETTNVLWPWKYGANNAITNYLGTYHVYLTNVSNIQALEYDQFGFHNAGSPGNRFMQGSECDNPSLTAGFWRIWNAKTASWVTTSVPCTIFTANTWHSIVWSTSVDPVTSTSCSGSPCMHYLGLTVDGVAQSGFPITEPSGTSSDPDNNGIQFQIDCSSAAGTCSEYIDEMSLVMSNSSYPVPVFPGVSIGSGVTIYNGTHGVSIQ
jgi:hypothetical protein